MAKPLLLFLLSLSSSTLWGQSIFDNPITGTNPSLDNPYTTGQNVNANITVSGIGRGSGINANAGADRYNANSWNTSSIDLTAYFYWTLTPNSGQRIDFTSLVYTGQASGTGPNSFALRSSVDNYTADIGAPDANGETISLTDAAYQNITSSITFRFYGWGASAATGTFSINDFTFNGTLSLPIELMVFSGQVEKSIIKLSFSTATEIDNSHFSIQRSPNGRDFVEIGQVKGAGTSYEPQDYTFTDEHPLQGKNYYRLKQVDFDGKYSFSPVVTTTFGKSRMMTLAPLPATEILNIQLGDPSKDDGIWQVYDMNGRLLHSGEMPAESTEQPIQIGELPKGAYVLRLAIGQEVMLEQFRKQ